MPHLSFQTPSRREFLRFGGIGALGLLGSGDLRRVHGRDDRLGGEIAGLRPRQIGDRRLCLRRTEPDRHLGPEARSARRRSRRVSDRSTPRVPGTFVGEHLPRLAKCVDKLTIVRSMSHDDLDHGTATYLTLTGKPHKIKSGNPPPSPTDEPTLGAALRAARRNRAFPYDAVHLNGPLLSPRDAVGGSVRPATSARSIEPLMLGDVTRRRRPLPDLATQPDLPPVRMHERQSLKNLLDGYARKLGDDAAVARRRDALCARRSHCSIDPQTRSAFDLQSRAGRAFAIATAAINRARPCCWRGGLVEAGLPLVTVFWSPSNRGQDTEPDVTDAYGWDTHNDIFDALRQASAAAIRPGLLGAAGRSRRPRACSIRRSSSASASSAGRRSSRWRRSSPAARRDASIGPTSTRSSAPERASHAARSSAQSDRIGGRPDSRRYGPWDTIATIYSALGIDPASHFKDQLGRPIPLCTGEADRRAFIDLRAITISRRGAILILRRP